MLAPGFRVAYPGADGVAYLGTAVEEDLDYVAPHWRVEWDDRPEAHQSVPEELLLLVTPLQEGLNIDTTTGTPRVYAPRRTHWSRFGYIYSALTGMGAVSVGVFALLTLH